MLTSKTFDLEETIASLRATPAVIRNLLARRDDAWVRADYGPGTFSPFDVLGHLIEGERSDWMARARIILQEGESRPFDPFDHRATDARSADASVARRLDLFDELRVRNIAALEGLNVGLDDLARTGVHPALGTVTLEQLLATWVVHDLHHVAQMCKGLARRQRGAVGPWAPYVAILGPPA